MWFSLFPSWFQAKIWCENGEMVMRCSVLMLGLLHFGFKKTAKTYAVTAVVVFVAGCCHVEIGKILCGCGESEVRLRRFPYVIQVIARLFSAKTLCENCKNVCDFGECVVVCGDLYVLFR